MLSRAPFLRAAALLTAVLVPATTMWSQAPSQREIWNQPQEPFRIHGNTFYVGTRGLSSILIASPEGHILIDGALPESAPLIAASIQKLGFQLEDVKLLLNSHVHFDHAGGIAALQRLTGARIAASAWSAPVLAKGGVGKGDPQEKALPPLSPARNVSTIRDGEVLQVGSLAVTARFTPGHTPGGTSWTWRSCDGPICRDIVYADSLTAVSADGFRFTKDYPGAERAFAGSFAFLESAPCDVLLTAHPELSDLFTRRDRGDFVDPGACRNLAQRSREQLKRRLESERR